MNLRAASGLGMWLAFMTLSACSWLVDPEREAAQCVIVDGGDPCPANSACVKKHCTAAVCRDVEQCGNGIDDNCNGKVDEEDPTILEKCDHIDNNCNGKVDEGYDYDGDGVPWCDDNVDPNSGDCDDYNANVHPSAAEVCDGLDNDCDKRTDEGDGLQPLCPFGKQCVNGECSAPTCSSGGAPCNADQLCVEGVCVDRGCPEIPCETGKQCDVATHTCTPIIKLRNGELCIRSSDCASNACADAATMRIVSERICVQACCDDSGCPAGDVCIASGTGARSCMPKSAYVGEPLFCASACEPSSQSCSACPQGTRCQIASFMRPEGSLLPKKVSVCSNLPSFKTLGEPCVLDQECLSQVCVSTSSNLLARVCSMPCGVSSECAPLFAQVGAAAGETVSRGAYCRYIKPGLLSDVSADRDWVPACAIERGETLPSGTIGSACSNGLACADGACVGATASRPGKCAPTCCNDAQCKTLGGGEDYRCLAVPRGGDVYEMRCLKP